MLFQISYSRGSLRCMYGAFVIPYSRDSIRYNYSKVYGACVVFVIPYSRGSLRCMEHVLYLLFLIPGVL